jgi:endothelin-converting enzyme/putative endopeptidase
MAMRSFSKSGLLAVLTAGAAAAALLSACSKPTAPPAPAASEAPRKASVGSFGVDLAQMDTAVRPGDDFYRYVNGKWLTSFEIPADRSRYSTGSMVAEKAEADLHAIVDELAASKPAEGTVARKIADVYAAWMDEAAIEARGSEPLKPYLAQVAAVSEKAGLMKLMGQLDFQLPFSLSVDADAKDPTRYTVWVGQGGLGMPNRDYYLKSGEKFDAYRAAYKGYVAKLFSLANYPAPEKSADAVVALETKLASAQWTPERQRNVAETINPMDRAHLKAFAPNIDWDVVLAGLGLGGAQGFIVGETTAIRDNARLVDSVPLADWKAYEAFHVIDANANALPKAFDDANFEFRAHTLSGIQKKRDRWKRGVALIDRGLGEGLGQVYVARHFPPEAKAQMDLLVAGLRAALKDKIEHLAWMDEPTRAEALKKLAAFEPRVGYPDKFRDYAALVVEPGKHFENNRAMQKFEWDRTVKRLNDKVDRGEWFMTPQTVDAYYDALKNQITFPAGILQPPMFDPYADPAVNYGSIGAVIGHEIGHGFDDQGRQFDGDGRVRNWWTPATATKFVAMTKALGAQYSGYCPIPNQCVNSALTMGENIGDLGGLEMAYAAYKLSLNGKEAPVIGGFTGDQRFFIAFAQAWRGKGREDAIRAQMLTDPHSPHEARGTYPERNMDAWYAAFDVKEGDKLYLKPDARVHVW